MLTALLIGAVIAAGAWFPGIEIPSSWIWLCMAGCIFMAGIPFLRADSRASGFWDWRWGAPLIIVLVLVGIQAVNASHSYVQGSRALVPKSHASWFPRSVDRDATTLALCVMAMCAAAFWLARCRLFTRGGRLVFVSSQVLCGVAMALLEISQRKAPPPGALYPVTGAFANSNHFAAYVNVVLSLTVAWAAACWTTIRHQGLRILTVGALGLAAVVLVYSILRSGSRMGVAVCGFIAVSMAVAVAWRGGVRRRVFLAVAAGAGILLTAGVVREWRGCEGGWSLRQLAESMSGRFEVQRAAASMIPDRWMTGFGAGTFERAFPYYQPPSLRGGYRHAHNEYLQCVIEFGILGSLVLGWLIYAACAAPVRTTEFQSLTAWERMGSVLALVALGLHAMTDFPFRVPALCLMAATVAGMSGGEMMIRRFTGVRA